MLMKDLIGIISFKHSDVSKSGDIMLEKFTSIVSYGGLV
jgi:hypothetical protein